MNDKSSDMKEQKNVQNIYAAFAAALIFQFIPLVTIQVFGFFLFIGVLVAAYMLRGKSETESLAYNHAHFIIRTIWIWSLFLMVGMVIAVPWFSQVADHSIIQSFLDQVSGGMMPSHEMMNDVMKRYMLANLADLLFIAGVALGPSMVYIIYRFAKGLTRALKGHRIGNVKNWF